MFINSKRSGAAASIFFVALLWGMAGNSSRAFAQESRAEVIGTVTDATGAAVRGARVTIVNTTSSEKLEAITNGVGDYTISYVQPGTYTETVTASGFNTAQMGPLHLDIGQRQQLNVRLKVGAASQRIEVSAASPLLQTSDANIGQVIGQMSIEQLPLVNGSPYELVFLSGLAPGATTSLSSQQMQPDTLQGVSTDIVAGGTPHGSSEWTIDGVPNTTTTNANYGIGLSISPPTDAVQEFRTEINYDASFGHTSSYIVNAVLKTGGNDFHGSGYIYGRTPSLDANLWFNDHYPAGRTLPVPQFTYQRYGGSFTGPVRLPKLYDGRGRTFFAYSLEHLSLKGASTVATLTVPTAKEQQGDFTERLSLSPNPAGPTNPYTIYDPATIQLAGGVYTMQPLQCNGQYNVICASRIDKIGQTLMKFYPSLNAAGAANGTQSNYLSSIPSPDLYWSQMLRLDQTVTDKQRFYIRFGFEHRDQGPYRNFWNSPAVGNTYIGDPKQGVIDYTWTVSQHLVTDFRYGYTHTTSGHSPSAGTYDLSTLGFSSSVASELSLNGRGGIPWVRTLLGNTYGGDIGQEGGGDYRFNDIHTFLASAVRDFGHHTIKVGLDARAYRLNTGTFGYSAGYYYFGGIYDGASTVNGALPAGSAIGASLASMLLGLPQAGYIDRESTQAAQSTYWAPYIHDTWRITSKLTTDLGLRFEYYGPPTERFNRAVAGFDPNAHLSITSAAVAAYAAKPDISLPVSQFRSTGGLLFAGLDVNRRGFWQKPLGVFAPRFGYAFDARKSIVIRGGFGIFAISDGQDGQASDAYNGGPAFQYGFSNETQFVPTLNNGLSFVATLDNPFPSGITSASNSSQGVNTFVGNAVEFYQTNLKTPYAMQWHQGVQVQLPSQILAEVDYEGSKGTNLELLRNIGGVPDAYLEDQPNMADVPYRNYLAAPVPNPFAGLLPGSTLNGSTITRSQLVSPYPQFTGVQEWVSQGSSNYNAITLRTERRFANGISFQASYTWSRLMSALNYLNPLDPKPAMEISGYDRPSHLAITSILELPIGRGHVFLSNVNGFVDRVVSGWQLNNIYQIYSGFPIAFNSNFIFNGNWSQVSMSSHPIVNAGRQWFNTAGFDQTNSALMGGMLRSKPIYYPSLRTGTSNMWNFSITKRTRIHDSINTEFRAEAFNVLNHPSGWPAPDTTFGDATFGQVISNPSNDPRVLQFGGRVTF